MYLSQRLASDSEDRADERQMPERRRVTSHKAQAEPDRVRANINSEKNAEILKKCETLRQYSRFVEIMRSYKEDSELTNDVIVEVLDRCKKEGILTEFLDKYGTEIVEMLFKELTREEDLEISRLDGYEEGFNSGERAGFSKGERAGFSKGERAGAERGAKQKQCEIAKNFKKSGIPIDVIAKNTGLSEKEIAEL